MPISDQQAQFLQLNAPFARDDQKPKIERALAEWRHGKRLQTWDQIENLELLQGPEFDPLGLPEGGADRLKKRELVGRFLADEYGQPEDEVRLRLEDYSHDYAAKRYNEGAGLDPLRLYDRVKVTVGERKAAAAMQQSAATAAQEAAIARTEEFHAIGKWQQGARGQKGYKPEHTKVWFEAYKATRTVLEEADVDGFLKAVGTQRNTKVTDEPGWQFAEIDTASPVDEYADRLMSMEPSKRRVALTAIAKRMTADEAGAGESFREGIVRLFTGWTLEEQNALDKPILVPSDAKITTAEEANTALLDAVKVGAATGYSAVGAGEERTRQGVVLREPTAAEGVLLAAARAKAHQRIDIGRELKALADGTLKLDPMASTLGGSLALGGIAIATAGAALPLNASIYTENNYNQIRLEHPDIARNAARGIAATAGVLEAGLDAWDIKLFKGLPNVAKLLKDGLTKTALKTAGKKLAAAYVFENVQEGAQDAMLPLVTSLAVDVPSVDWRKEVTRWKKGEPRWPWP